MAQGVVGRFRVRRDAYGWQVGGGHRHLLRGTLVEGRVLRHNTRARRVIIDTREGVLSLNEEDLEPAG